MPYTRTWIETYKVKKISVLFMLNNFVKSIYTQNQLLKRDTYIYESVFCTFPFLVTFILSQKGRWMNNITEKST